MVYNKAMNRAYIFANGELSDLSLVKKRITKDDFLVAADGGLKHVLKLELKPDLVIGDMDSVEKDKLKKSYPVINDPDVDQTDVEVAINYLEKKEFKELVLVGVLGRRVDHLLANVMILAKRKIKISLIEGRQEAFVVRDRVKIEAEESSLVSLIPLFSDCKGVKTDGLKWNLQGRTLKVGKAIGISNVMVGNKAEVSLKSGTLLVVVTKATKNPL